MGFFAKGLSARIHLEFYVLKLADGAWKDFAAARFGSWPIGDIGAPGGAPGISALPGGARGEVYLSASSALRSCSSTGFTRW